MKCRSKSPIIINPQSKPSFEQAALVYKRRQEIHLMIPPKKSMPSLPNWALSYAHLGIAVMVWTPNFSPNIIWCFGQLNSILESAQNPVHSPNVQKMKGLQLTLVYAKLLLCRSSVMMTFLHIPYYTTHSYKHRLLFFYSVLSDLAFVDEKTVLAASTIGPIWTNVQLSISLFFCPHT